MKIQHRTMNKSDYMFVRGIKSICKINWSHIIDLVLAVWKPTFYMCIAMHSTSDNTITQTRSPTRLITPREVSFRYMYPNYTFHITILILLKQLGGRGGSIWDSIFYMRVPACISPWLTLQAPSKYWLPHNFLFSIEYWWEWHAFMNRHSEQICGDIIGKY